MGVEQNISSLLQKSRHNIARKFSYLLRQEINPGVHGGLEKARALVKQGYGLIIVYNHFSMREGADAVEFAIQQPILGDRPISVPIAWHQYYSPFRPILDYLQKKATINFHPIVNEDTKDKKKFKDLTEGLGIVAYTRASLRTLKKGGVVTVAIQTGRRSHLYEKGIKKSLSTLMKLARRGDFNKYAVLFVGIEKPGVKDYSTQKRKFNLFRKYRFNVGDTFTAEELLALAGDIDHVDEAAYKQLEPLVAKSYLKQSTPTSSSPGI